MTSPAPSDLTAREPDTETETVDTVDSRATTTRDQDEVSSRQPDGNASEAPGPQRRKRPSRLSSFLVRAKTTIVLIGSFCLFIWMGHVPLMGMILGIQYLMVRELYSLSDKAHRQKHKELADKRKAPRWYFFFVATFWMYFRFMQKQLIVELRLNPTIASALGWAINQHSIIAFALYVGGFVAFVLRLEKGYYIFQFRQYAWVHLILLFVFMPSSFFVSNIFDGIIWFLLPCSLVITNDIGAYLAGIAIGRTPLIKLSPKKTWEGFFGGMLMTLGAAWALADYMSNYKWLICPRTDLSMGWLHCEPDDLFKPAVFGAPDLAGLFPSYAGGLVRAAAAPLRAALELAGLGRLVDCTFVARPIQLHALVMALFASIIAPFGGFFASGFKRSFKIKDFGDSIPGHGGMTDRMDCQVVMAVFSYLYYNNYVARFVGMSLDAVLESVLQLDSRAQLELFSQLGGLLAAQHQIPKKMLQDIAGVFGARNSSA